MKNKSLFGKRAASLFVDVLLIYCISILLQTVIWSFAPVSFITVFTFTFPVYYLVLYLFLAGRTPAKELAGVKIINIKPELLNTRQVFIREVVAKFLMGLLTPAFIIWYLFGYKPSCSLPLLVLAGSVFAIGMVGIISLIGIFIYKRPWWEIVSSTALQKQNSTKKRLRLSLWTISSIMAIALLIILYPVLSGKKNIKHSFYPKYPETKEVDQYANFIRFYGKSPVDYVFNLFERYDIVVVSERMHPEYTQYEFINKIIADPRFTEKVGNLFTECGSASFQDTLNTFMQTKFATEDALNAQTALLQRNSNGVWPLWDNTNLFDLFKNVNKLNQNLPDSLKTHWYFTDLAVDWRQMNHQKFLAGYGNIYRDSIMAANVIMPYIKIISKQHRKKALVIMNTRHGYALNGGSIPEAFKKEYATGTTVYLNKFFPGKVANIMMNTVSMKYGYIFTPVQDGKWDAAFALAGNKDAGFDFKNSPFGDDVFDVAFRYCPEVTYKDIFTGFVFFKPLEEHFEETGFPHEFDDFKDTIIRRSSYINAKASAQMKERMAMLEKEPETLTSTDTMRYALIMNLITVLLMPLLIVTGFITSIVLYAAALRRFRMQALQ